MKIEQSVTQSSTQLGAQELNISSGVPRGMTDGTSKGQNIEGHNASFRTVLDMVSTELKDKVANTFNDYINTWNASEASLEKRLKQLSPENKNLIEMQIDINNFNLKTLFLTQCAEACNGTIRRVQQMGSN